MNAAIAQHLNILESAIVRVEEWSKVLFVVARGIGARFVSKKVVKMPSLLNRAQSPKQAEAAQDVLNRLNSDIDKLVIKLQKSNFFIVEQDPRCEGSFANYVYKRLGVDTQAIIESLHGDKVFAQEKLEKLVASIENMKQYLNEKATARFILDNGSFALGEVFVQTFKAVNRKA